MGSLLQSVNRCLAAVGNMWQRFLDYRLKRLEMKLAAQRAPFEALMAATNAQNEFLKEWLGNFKVDTLNQPTSTVVRDIDEWNEEQERQRLGQSELHESVHNAIKAGASIPLMDIFGEIN